MAKKPADIKLILAEASDKPSIEEQSAYLARVCGDDVCLRQEVESLLQMEDKVGDFLESPVLDPGMTLDESPISEGPGTVIDRYKLLEKIGEGGMAVVYMAEQAEPIRRKVALKIIKLGMDTKSVIARFEAERQALAMMDHPNIAKVLDAGATETGRPYFVMELVTGVSITEYCDKNNLSTKERLALFIQVCNAVQHAHQKGIIHRDIKPTNVMVTRHEAQPIPKVIDFGIAKAINQKLTEKTLFTRYAHIIGTPAYMSPEQADLGDLDVDTRSDIYSLGVLLYELLTGATPFSEEELRKAGYLEMQRVIREQEPVKPSTKLSTLGETLTDIAKHHGSTPDLLRKAIRGDLDWIVMKALEKTRDRRYDTVSVLAVDIQRHLSDEPVLARAPSTIYRLNKFLRRHKSEAVAALGIALIICAVIVALSMWKQKRQEYDKAELARQSSILSQAYKAVVWGHDARALGLLKQVLDSRHIGHEARIVHDQILINARDGVRRCTVEIEANPEDAINYLDRARCYHILNDTENVHADMKKYRTILNPPEVTSEYKRWVKDLIRQQQDSHLLFGTPINLGPPINGPSDDWAPSISADGLELYFDSNRSGGFGGFDIWIATRAAKDETWGEPVNLGPMINGSNWEQAPRISADGLSLFFGSDRRGGSGKWDIWIATRETRDTDWSSVVNLGSTINSSADDLTPSISFDGLSLFFGSNRPGGFGNRDLWLTTRETPHNDWGTPINLAPPINSEFCEIMGSISADGRTLVIGSSGIGPYRPGGQGRADLWLATRATSSDPWGAMVNLGPAINSSSYDVSPCFTADGSKLYFASNRPGGFGGYDIWQVSIIPKPGDLQEGGDSDLIP
ncbi:protein kinase [Planctomycetota bacterium]